MSDAPYLASCERVEAKIREIKDLTPEQEEILEEVADYWTKASVSTEPTDFERCKELAIEVYKWSGKEPPKEFVILDSPEQAVKYCEEQLGVERSDIVFAYGSMDGAWLSFWDFYDRIGVDIECYRPLVEMGRICGWWIPHDDVCIFTHRPEEIHLDGERLHNESGPSVRFRDGLSLWTINNVTVDEQIVMHPETQTIEQIMAEDNEEVKRLRIERYGWANFLIEAGAEKIDERINDIEGTREALYTFEDQKVLVCACPSTAKLFCLEVDPEVTTCEEAQSYLSSGLSDRIISAS